MSLFEWIGESFNPGPTGDVEFGDGSREPERNLGWLAIQVLVSAALVGGFLAGVRHFAGHPHWPSVLGGLAAYLGIAFLLRPRADLDNLGWAGGLIDDPFRISDDWNRTLLFFSLVLWPGRFVSDTLADLLRTLVGR